MSYLYSLYDALVSISVPSDKARAVVESLERDMLTHLATKSDIDALRRETKADMDTLRTELRADMALVRQESKADISLLRHELGSGLSALRKDMTISLGSVQIIGMGLLFAALKLT
jgi:hypothetical protein